MVTNGAFRQESLDRIASPEQLGDYIRVTSPSAWLLLGAIFIITICIAVWGFTGTLPVTLSLNGLSTDNDVICFMPTVSTQKDILGNRAQITLPNGETISGVVTRVTSMPLSSEELAASLGKAWLISHLITADYSYQVTVATDFPLPPDTLVNVALIIDEIKPIGFIFS